MARQAREKSESGIYNVMLRGINKEQIFKDEEDFKKFIQVLKDCKEKSQFELYAYCLMGNHIHLLIKPDKEPIEQVFKRICGRFVYWYNVKYQRTGHLFQDRYKSEPVENDEYFLTVIRFIHQNPVKAGMCKSIDEYKVSSYHEYTEAAAVIDTDFVFKMISKQEFIEFNSQLSDDKCLDIEETETKIRLTDEQAQREIEKCSNCKNVTQFQGLKETSKENYINELREKGLSIRQLSRLTGVSVAIVRKWINS